LSAAATAIRRENLLLATLPGAERRQLIARCEPVELTLGEVLCEQGDQIRHVYFPTGSFFSVISSIDGRPKLELGLVGVEGMLGISLMLGVNVAPLRAIVQGAGSALRMDAAQFSREIRRSPALGKQLNRYLYILMKQLAQMAVCASFHVVEARLARWLLMTRDRAHSNEFRITQEFIAYMLGVRRAGITRAACMLQKRKLIRYNRGNMTVLDGRGLEAVSCECYAAAGRTYARIMTKRVRLRGGRGRIRGGRPQSSHLRRPKSLAAHRRRVSGGAVARSARGHSRRG
jgi:CRP-like cAMP-binding protein